MTPELAAKARALSPDARRVLMALAADYRPFRSLEDIWGYTGLSEDAVKRAARELGSLVCSQHTRMVPQHGLLVHAEQVSVLAEAVREVPAEGHLLSEEA